ncbi:hypothetical protein CONPUDRAFT_162870 [Coniophora puteana RWD-64-598 SS2]|uniref:Uncharacterized protein n=1 Tax=Coniophora puteana (strain RWD-64-598) TaxID=741705 RepID=A0A5M3N352_CONPW|nr:uncharacterized protein CONPUDRAFT_162870 [Coniophora puteana RWD-64-598 SS2]EIW85746.1 hypothetical protein CONPUDRAFT_162870 [Coniophora puteana RWD-64-598 SS2]
MLVVPAPSLRSPSIATLPPETMLSIFDYLYMAEKVPLRYSGERYTSLALFPLRMITVCRRWRDILALKTMYWESVVVPLCILGLPSLTKVLIGAFTRLETIELYLVSDNRDIIEASAENAHLETMMRLLAPFLHKCKTISIDMCYRSSTVIASRFLNALVARSLVYFSLVSHVTDSIEETPFASFISPNLETLRLDAQTFIGFAEAEGEPGVEVEYGRTLSITSYHPENESSTLTYSELICAIARFTETYGGLLNLAVEDVVFDGLDFGEPEWITTVSDVRFVDMDTSFLCAFFGYFDPPMNPNGGAHLSLTRCQLDIPISVQFIAELDLTGINDGVTIMYALKEWDGLTVNISDCPGFTDDILHVMASDYLCDEVYTFKFCNCPISVAAMRGFIASRSASENFEELYVHGAPSLSDEDKEWFTEKVPVRLTWNGEALKLTDWS